MIRYYDKENKFVEEFNPETGFYVRTGILRDIDKLNPETDPFFKLLLHDTNEDAFMRNFPQLIDVGIMGHCIHGASGLCMKSGVQCYQNGLKTKEPNMTFENFKRIVNECKGKTFQLALGGRGDVDQHENFEEIVKYCRENGIIPNFTSSGLGFNKHIVDICKKYCGAVAISQYSRLMKITLKKVSSKGGNKDCYIGKKDGLFDFLNDGWKINFENDKGGYEYLNLWYESNDYTYNAIKMLLDANVKTNIHYVLGKNTIDEAINRLKNNYFPSGINAVIFLLHKPVGLGSKENVLYMDDPRLKEFFELIDTKKFLFKIGFDSCTVPAILNLTSNINFSSVDSCEGGRHSCYITSDMKMLPCSFDNQELRWAYDISNDTIQNAWNSTQFEDFRNHFRYSCPTCKMKNECRGGCPIRREIVLCNREEKNLV